MVLRINSSGTGFQKRMVIINIFNNGDYNSSDQYILLESMEYI